MSLHSHPDEAPREPVTYRCPVCNHGSEQMFAVGYREMLRCQQCGQKWMPRTEEREKVNR